MNKKIKILLCVFIFCILSNFPPLSYAFQFADEEHYQYSNYNGSNTTQERIFKPGNLAWIKRLHQTWLAKNPNTPDKKLYRVFWKNPLAFWRWKSYFFDERYHLPYKNKEEILQIREKNKGSIKRYRTAF